VALPLVSQQPAEQERFATANLRRAFSRLLSSWHLASLDAPTVAVVWALAFARTAGVRLDLGILLLIACGTWTVYVGDRLLDARHSIRACSLAPLRERHFFHWRNRRKFLPLAVSTSAVAALLILHLMPVAVREHDSVIAGAALAYFSCVHSRARFPAWVRQIASKELLVGVLFTAGCAAPAFAQLNWKFESNTAALPVLACVMFFAALAGLNCIAIETWESGLDRFRIRKIAALIGTSGTAIALALSFQFGRASDLVCAGVASTMLLLLLDLRRDRIAPLTLRALADLVLLTPAVFIALGAHAR
jgi:hypothetical protein